MATPTRTSHVGHDQLGCRRLIQFSPTLITQLLALPLKTMFGTQRRILPLNLVWIYFHFKSLQIWMLHKNVFQLLHLTTVYTAGNCGLSHLWGCFQTPSSGVEFVNRWPSGQSQPTNGFYLESALCVWGYLFGVCVWGNSCKLNVSV